MHTIEPYYKWQDDYSSVEDEQSPFYGREYNEFEYTNLIYNYYIHPHWDFFGSETLYLKVLYVDYDRHYSIIEFIGEWNDAINNDIMFLKRELLDLMIGEGINKFIFIGENVLNFHGSDDCYYEELFQDLEDGWMSGINFLEHVRDELKIHNIDSYINMGGILDEVNWRALKPVQVFKTVEEQMQKRLSP